MKLKFLLAALLLSWTVPSFAEPVWIWTKKDADAEERADFKTDFEISGEVKSATLKLTCDNGATALLNGKKVLENADWDQVSEANVKGHLKSGKNEILVHASNHGGTAALIATLHIETTDGKKSVVETSDKWLAKSHAGTEWKASIVMAKNGDAPWGEVFTAAKPSKTPATDPSEITAPPGFKVELLYAVPKSSQGSWVSMTVDKKGHIICGDQNGGLYRLIPPPVGSTEMAEVTSLDVAIGGAHGLLYAHDALYFMLNEGGAPQMKGKPHGLYKAKDKDGNDHFEAPVLLSECDGGGEHGPHCPVLGPDGSIYFNCGNHTKLPKNLTTSRAVPNSWDEDHILPRMWDANGHARGITAPGGYICKTDADGKNVEMFCSGFRNEFDFAFDANGEIFTYDADMEWDIGAPWYRPTRINHCVSGGEYGWRSGSGKWPAYYEDSLPATLDIGPGSPTGLIFGTQAKFPAKYQKALYGNDWTYGTMYAIHFEPSGATFKAVKEEFVFGKPLPLTAVVVNPVDGAMYFQIGGRGTQIAVYRVSYVGKESTARATPYAMTKEMTQRHDLEKLHQATIPETALSQIWPYLGSSDRYLRFAARTALEHIPVKVWTSKVLAEKDPQTLIEGAIALARMGRTEKHVDKNKANLGHSSDAVGPTNPVDGKLQAALLDALNGLEFTKLSPDLQMQLARAYQLAFTRLGKPGAAECAKIAARLEPWYPSKDSYLNRELCQLLVFLDSKKVTSQTLALMATAQDDTAAFASDELLRRNNKYGEAAFDAQASRPNQQQISLMFALRNSTTGWTPELRQTYFSYFRTAQNWKGGNSFKGFLEKTRLEALATVAPQGEHAHLDGISKVNKTSVETPKPKGPGRSYATDDIIKIVESGLQKRNFENGKKMFNAGLCAACHHFNGDGGNIGPDISKAGNRYSLKDLVENITEPSKVISDQYGSHQVLLNNGVAMVGRIVGEENGKLMMMTNPFAPDLLIAIDPKDIEVKKDYPVSMMPLGLLNTMNEDEIKDLMAYLLSGGNPEDKRFKP